MPCLPGHTSIQDTCQPATITALCVQVGFLHQATLKVPDTLENLAAMELAKCPPAQGAQERELHSRLPGGEHDRVPEHLEGDGTEEGLGSACIQRSCVQVPLAEAARSWYTRTFFKWLFKHPLMTIIKAMMHII